MSYILEALKKSDQQRQRGATPTLPTAPIAMMAPKQGFSVYYGLIAAILLCTGVVIGWLRPWQVDHLPTAAEPIAARSTISNQVAATPLSVPSEADKKMEQKLSVPNSISAVQAAPAIDAKKTDVSSSVSNVMASKNAAATPPLKKSSNPVDTTQEQKVIPLTELPLTIQQELPVMTIQLHSYSSNPTNSIVSINSRMMKEGESLTPGLRLEQITPDGVIFSYKGYRFQHGIW